MNCENIRTDLPLYIDDVLDDEAREAIESHLPSCPLCRQRVSDYGELRSLLGSISRPATPVALTKKIRDAVGGELGTPISLVVSSASVSFKDRLSHWLLPMSAGTLTAALFAFLLLNVMLLKPFHVDLATTGQGNEANILLASNTKSVTLDEETDFPRIELPERSPEVNPAGALVALTKSIVRGKMNDEEVVVVADVFGDGIASIAEIVDPPKSERALRELKQAFDTEPPRAPFLPTKVSSRSDAVRVVFKIRKVEVAN